MISWNNITKYRKYDIYALIVSGLNFKGNDKAKFYEIEEFKLHYLRTVLIAVMEKFFFTHYKRMRKLFIK